MLSPRSHKVKLLLVMLAVLGLMSIAFGSAVQAGQRASNLPDRATSKVNRPALTSTPTATATPSPTLCSVPPPPPLRVKPVTSPTNLLTQTIEIESPSSVTITVTAESGTFTTTQSQITMSLLPNTTHHLSVRAYRPYANPCDYGYSDTTTVDRNNQPLTIVQSAAVFQAYLPSIRR